MCGRHDRQGSPSWPRRKRGTQNQAIGKSKGGWTTKILALCDGLGNLVHFVLLPGNCHDTIGVAPLIEGIEFDALLGDKASMPTGSLKISTENAVSRDQHREGLAKFIASATPGKLQNEHLSAILQLSYQKKGGGAVGADQPMTTVISTKGQVILPKAIRDQCHWTTGTRLTVENTAEGVLLKAVPVFAETQIDEVFGSLHHDGPAVLIAEMDAAIMGEARRRARD